MTDIERVEKLRKAYSDIETTLKDLNCWNITCLLCPFYGHALCKLIRDGDEV